MRAPLLFVLSLSVIACGQVAPEPGGSGQPSQPANPQPSGPSPVACAIATSQAVSTLETNLPELNASIATNGASVFWSEGIGGATVMRAPKDGSAAATAMDGATGAVVAADEDAVYVVTGQGNAADFGIVRLPLDGSAPVTLVAGSTAITAVAIDDASIYWGASGSPGDCFSPSCPTPTPALLRAPKTGGGATTLGAFSASYLRVDGDVLYLGFQVMSDLPGAPSSSIATMPKAGGAPVTFASRPNAAISDIQLDAQNIYWAESDLSDTTSPQIVSMAKSGGTPTTITTIASHDPELALDAANVYWLDDETQSLMKTPKTGGAPVAVQGDQVTTSKFGGFGALTADSSGLYWSADVACGQSCTGKIVALEASCQ